MRKTIPKFRSEKEEALFWGKHSPLEYPHETEEIKKPFEFALYLLKRAAKEHKEKKRSLTFRMEQSQILLAKIIAKERGDNYQALLRKWIKEAIHKEIMENPKMFKDIRRQNLRYVN